MGKSTADKVGSALGKAWREATDPVESSTKRGVLSGMRGVVVGAGLGVLAIKKGEPLVRSALTRYVTSQASKATGQVDVPSADQPAGGSPQPAQGSAQPAAGSAVGQ